MALYKKVEEMVALMEPHKKQAVQVLVDQMKAMRDVYYEGEVVGQVPDQIIRQKAAIAILEWLEGKPREFQINVSGKPEDYAEILQRARETSAWKSLQKTVQGKEIPPALPEPPAKSSVPASS
jgi:hypothetical protein